MKTLFANLTVSRTRFNLMSLALWGALVMLPGVAHASHHLAITPATCMPDDSDWAAPVEFAFNTDGSASFASGKSGIVTLRCNITNVQDDGSNPTDWTSSEITFQDSSTVVNEHVIVTLRQIDNVTGAVTSETLLNSDDSDPTTGLLKVNHTLTTISFDFGFNTYYIDIHLHRTGTTATEKVLFVGF